MNKRQHKKKEKKQFAYIYMNRNKAEKFWKGIAKTKEDKFAKALDNIFINKYSEDDWNEVIKNL